jgi:2-polyprenyl-3-methyl-5-hydroxy-6-metoxy-1,4-benzoquinol methylase
VDDVSEHPTTRWIAETGGTRGPEYAEQFRALVAGGVDVHGEAAFLDGLVGPGSRVLDAGCGTGRVGLELARRGHRVAGLDVDVSMLEVARADALAEGLDVHLAVGDLLDAERLVGGHGPFDLVAAPGNVIVYLAPGTEADVVRALAGLLRPGGLLVAGFAADRHVSRTDLDTWCAAAGLTRVEHLGGWDGVPDDGRTDDAAYVVTVHRR